MRKEIPEMIALSRATGGVWCWLKVSGEWGVKCELDGWRWSGSSDRESGKAQAQMALRGKLSSALVSAAPERLSSAFSRHFTSFHRKEIEDKQLDNFQT
jgi:hypothetical protein